MEPNLAINTAKGGLGSWVPCQALANSRGLRLSSRDISRTSAALVKCYLFSQNLTQKMTEAGPQEAAP